MKPRTSITTLSLIALAALAGCASTDSSMNESNAASRNSTNEVWNAYGDAVVVDEVRTVSLGSLRGDEKNIWVEGEIFEVCTHQGCWIRLKDPKNPAAGDLFVRTKGHAYLVPINSKGHTARVYGECEFSEMSVNDQKHYAEEAGHSEAQIALITQPRKMITFHADTILIEGQGLDQPLDQ